MDEQEERIIYGRNAAVAVAYDFDFNDPIIKDKKNEYIKFAMKPLKRGFKMAQKRLEIPNENIAAIGDQIFTDVIGANRMKMFSILVEPIEEKDIFVTLIKRPIENYIKKKYFETKDIK